MVNPYMKYTISIKLRIINSNAFIISVKKCDLFTWLQINITIFLEYNKLCKKIF